MHKLLRYVRIAVSVVSLIACMLLIALWVRSYRGEDSASLSDSPTRVFRTSSLQGRMSFSIYSPWGLTWPWALANRPMDDGLRKYAEFVREQEIGMGFGILHESPTSWAVVIPHWSGVLATAGLAAAPWFKWRFSLRTILIVTTMVAVVLGLAFYAATN